MNLKLKNQLKVASDYRRKRETYDSLLTPCLTITVALVLVAIVVLFNSPSHTTLLERRAASVEEGFSH